LIDKYCLHIVLTLETLSIGGSTVLTYHRGSSDFEQLLRSLNIFSKHVDTIDSCEYTDLLHKIFRAGKSVFLIDRDIVDGEIIPVISGSTVKGVFRSVFEKMVLEKIIDCRKELLADTDLIEKIYSVVKHSSVFSDVFIKFMKEVLQDYFKDNVYKSIAKNVLASYLLAINPYTCLSTLSRLSCSFPQDIDRMRLFNEVNKLLINRDNVCGCLVVNGARHCLPINYACATCALFGIQGYLSIPRFRTFTINCYQPKIVTFNRVFAGKSFVIPFSMEVLGLDKPIEARGTIELVIDPKRIKDLVELTYLKYIRHSDNVLDKDIAMAIEGLITSKREDIADNIIHLYKTLFNKILGYLKDSGAKLGIGFGRRRKVGFGRLIDYKISVV